MLKKATISILLMALCLLLSACKPDPKTLEIVSANFQRSPGTYCRAVFKNNHESLAVTCVKFDVEVLVNGESVRKEMHTYDQRISPGGGLSSEDIDWHVFLWGTFSNQDEIIARVAITSYEYENGETVTIRKPDWVKCKPY